MRRTLIALALVSLVATGLALCTRLGRKPAPPTEARVETVAAPAPSSPPALPRMPMAPSGSVDAGARAGRIPEEDALLAQVRALVRTDPSRAEALARESRRRFPEGETADERDALLVDALINQQRIGRARDETYYYFDHHPEGRHRQRLFIMTGIKPRPRTPSR